MPAGRQARERRKRTTRENNKKDAHKALAAAVHVTHLSEKK